MSSSSVTTAIKKQHVPKLGYQQVVPFGAYWMWQDYFNHPSFTSAKIFRYHLWNFWPGFHSCNFPNFSGLYQLVQAGTSWYKLRKVFCRFADASTWYSHNEQANGSKMNVLLCGSMQMCSRGSKVKHWRMVMISTSFPLENCLELVMLNNVY